MRLPLQVKDGNGDKTMLEHMGIRWGYVFLRTSSHLANEEMSSLMMEATEMYLLGEEERKVKSDQFEGRLYTERRYEILGEFGGQRFDADLDTIYGTDKAAFIVNEQTGGGGVGPSRN